MLVISSGALKQRSPSFHQIARSITTYCFQKNGQVQKVDTSRFSDDYHRRRPSFTTVCFLFMTATTAIGSERSGEMNAAFGPPMV